MEIRGVFFALLLIYGNYILIQQNAIKQSVVITIY